MPWAEASDGVRIHYSVAGPRHGEPLLLLQGLGADKKGWILQRRVLTGRYRCIALDNRGVGRSDKPEGIYDLVQMADDAIRVLDAAGYESAHVMGASMGGILSQIIAVQYPERVRSVILACTSARHHQWRVELLEMLRDTAVHQGMPAATQKFSRWVVGPRSFRRFWPAIALFTPLALNVPPHAFAGQIQAMLDFDDGLRHELSTISAPTLVIVGSQDILTPQGDSEEIAEHIPGSELVVVRGAPHILMVETARTFNAAVVEFLDRAVAARRATQPDDLAA